MKKHGVLNRDIAAILARLGHTDKVVIADCGLPIPEETPCIDVSIKQGYPRFGTVLEAILEDMEVESMTLANEIKAYNESLYEQIRETYKEIPISYQSHEELKDELKQAKAIIRTGENTPFANVILQAGVIF
ncbi:D-ribose pyranase [Pontibacillus sp. HMF3514]|uniref:D-ribose pyranase n=1 Tax=Pontibacillus sp. HMF3514 TaxID=2692425 RepID=UPI001320106F|nr:D-ribose pyranase [Pontibacillus sp. HMF3514]QHE53916.1 D-ribose pyranase [Pontibacillus sp. HMF3514]